MTVELTKNSMPSKMSILNLFFLEHNNAQPPQTRFLSSVTPNFRLFSNVRNLQK